MALFEPIFEALNGGRVRYVVVGGVATVLHGFARLTADLDLIIDLAPEPAANAIRVLGALGFRPRAPVRAEDFADPEKRREWVQKQGMRVFSMWDPTTPLREIDIFVDSPISFEELWQRSEQMSLSDTVVRVAAIEDLIYLKSLAGRPEDLQDIEALTRILERRKKKS